MSDDIAGLTRRVPQPDYSAVVPGMGRVTLQRDRPRHFALALTLEPAFAASLSTGRSAPLTSPCSSPLTERFRGTVGDLRALIS
ncbi:MAG: hypothetical protein U0325_19195 [Polyangiales bacterium]